MHWLFVVLILVSNFAMADSSFNGIRREIYERPLNSLPTHPGLSPWSIITNLIGSSDFPSHGLSIRSRRTLVDTSDYRPSEPKWLHPRGACATGKWIIDQDSEATGLFAKGTVVSAIVRISSGTADSENLGPRGPGRIFGAAIKLYPTQDPDQKVTTRNIITLDQAGFERSHRSYMFVGDQAHDPVYFTNVMPARSTLGKFLSSFFDRFDEPNFARPVGQVASVTANGDEVKDFKTPYEIRFSAPSNTPVPRGVYKDFRQELANGESRTLEITIHSFDPRRPMGVKIGRLELDPFVVSDFCDLRLHFHHTSIENQWTKYSDYEVVKDLRP